MRKQYRQRAYQLILDARVKSKHEEHVNHQVQMKIDTNKIRDKHESIWPYPHTMTIMYKNKGSRGRKDQSTNLMCRANITINVKQVMKHQE